MTFESTEPTTHSTTRARLCLRVEGMDCADEVALLRRVLIPLVGTEDRLAFDVVGGRVWVTTEQQEPPLDSVVEAIATTGMRATLSSTEGVERDGELDARQRRRTLLTVAAGVAAAVGIAIDAWLGSGLPAALGAAEGDHVVSWPARAMYGVTILIAYWYVAPRAWAAARRMRPDMNLLMTIAVIGAVVIGEWLEAAAVSFLFALSLTIEGWSAGRARHALDAILRLAPERVRVVDADGRERDVSPNAVEIGTHFLVQPGDRVPLDGTVVEGSSHVDEAPITGESLPVAKEPSSEVFAGTINGDGALRVASTHTAGDTVLARVVRLIADAGAQRAPVERWVDRFAAIYTPVVLILAVLIAVVPPAVAGAEWSTWTYRALVLLVIACPCALVISTPVSLVSALAAAARSGVLVKGGSHLEVLSRVRAIALDKTGTVSEGRPRVVEIVALIGGDEDVLAMAASVESRSEHPLARAIVAEAEQRGVAFEPATEFKAVPGKGARARVRRSDGSIVDVWVGSLRFVRELGIETRALAESVDAMARSGRTVILVGTDDDVHAMIALADGLRAESLPALSGLSDIGIDHIALLTGDNQGSALQVAQQCGIEDVRAELLPHDKVSAIEELIADHEFVAMVGDGVNDAPALARASIGIAMGAAGTDAAIETADVALMADDLRKLPWLIDHARRALRTVRVNVAISLGVKAVFVLLAATGYASLWAAIAADMGASLVVTLNGLALLRRRSVLDAVPPTQTEEPVPRSEPRAP